MLPDPLHANHLDTPPPHRDHSIGQPFRAVRGFSLIETLIAATLVATAVAALAHLVALGARQTSAGRHETTALAAAQSKLEQLRALTWTYAADGGRLSDETADLSVDPPAPTGGPGLRPSPAGSLAANIDGYVDYLDDLGAIVAAAAAGAHAVYFRRWAISPLEPSDPDALLLQACVFARDRAGRHDARAGTCISTIRVRKP